ncbi:MAG: hypothetical protein KGQ56_04760 [Acidobacteria bacterium]|nr:hypothetical protein [Acidobacteriota bacterium]NDC48157.1 hypothetical protein [Micrococcales bacterium]
MKIEIHAKRGDTATSLEIPQPGALKLNVQMGLESETLAEHLRDILHPEILSRIISLWANPDHCREFVEDGRTLIIRDCA